MGRPARPPKPRLFETVFSSWGRRCRARRFHNDEDLHAAIQDYADALGPEPPVLEATVVFIDDSEWEIFLRREEKFFSYKDYDGEVWEQACNGKRWVVEDSEIAVEGTASSSPEKAVLNYLPPESLKEVKTIKIHEQ